jgi:hypothetical protein
LSIFGRSPQCASIDARLRNLTGGSDAGAVRRLRAEVNAACAPAQRETQRVVRSEPARDTRRAGDVILHGTREDNQLDGRSRGGNFFTRLFGGRNDEVIVEQVRVDPAARSGTTQRTDAERERRRRDGAGSGSGEIRSLATGNGGKILREGSSQTVCVRLCDGFYFPINNRSHSDNFNEELAMCVGRCPGADVSLYVHGSGEAVESMRSTVTGEPYARLPTAFAYRKTLVSNCGCGPDTTVATARSADEALSYLGAGGGSDAEAAATAAGTGNWTPLRAVYDATGKPLDLSIGVDQTAPRKSASPASAQTPVEASSVATAPAPGSAETAVAGGPAGSAPGAAAPPADLSAPIRTVGEQFFSDAAPETKARAPLTVPQLLTGARNPVTVVPIRPARPAGARTSAIDDAMTGG